MEGSHLKTLCPEGGAGSQPSPGICCRFQWWEALTKDLGRYQALCRSGYHGERGQGNWAGPWGSWAQRPLRVPFLMTGNRLHSISLIFPIFPEAVSKQLLIRDGRGCRDKEKQPRETVVQPWGRVLSPPQGYTEIFLRCFAGVLNPHEGRSYYNCKPPKHKDPRPGVEPEVWWYWLPRTLQPGHPKNVRKLIPPSWIITIKLLTTFPDSDHNEAEDFSELLPHSPVKAIKLFFSTSAKTLPLSFNSVLGVQRPDLASVRALRTLGTWVQKDAGE